MYDVNGMRELYNNLAETYLEWLNGRPTPHEEKLEQILALMSPKSRVLELGCGAGVPITKTLVGRGHIVTANDLSEKQIELAKKYVPGPTYIVGDMTRLELPPNSFDAVLAFYTLFHVPREHHLALFEKIHLYLRPGGHFLATFLLPDEASHVEQFLGATTFYSGYGTVNTVKMVEQVGFQIVQSEVRAQGDVEDPDDPDNGISFHWVQAKKK